MNEKTIEKVKMLIFYNRRMIEYYSILEEYEIEHRKPHCSYKDISNKMREIIDKEDEIYNNLNMQEIKEIVTYIENTIKEARIKTRIIGHLGNRMQILLLDYENANKTSFVSIADSTIDILSLREIDKLLDAADEIDAESIKEFYKYWVISKFAKLRKNRYIEKLAIENDFDICRIKTMSSKDIEAIYGKKAISKLERKYIFSLMADLDKLNKLDSLNGKEITGIFRTYEAMILLMNIKEKLAFLRKENFNEFKTIFYLAYGNNNKEQMQHAKKLIRQKEEALNN